MGTKRLTDEQLRDIVAEVSGRIGYAVPDSRIFAAYLLEVVNDHMTAGALRALELGDVELACDYLRCRPEKAFFTEADNEVYEAKVSALELKLDALRASQKK